MFALFTSTFDRSYTSDDHAQSALTAFTDWLQVGGEVCCWLPCTPSLDRNGYSLIDDYSFAPAAEYCILRVCCDAGLIVYVQLLLCMVASLYNLDAVLPWNSNIANDQPVHPGRLSCHHG
jgi:hypothetical protein